MPQNLWNTKDAKKLPDLDGLVYRSNFVGRDRVVMNIYGGSTSAKLTLIDHIGQELKVLAVKAIYDTGAMLHRQKGYNQV